MFVLVKQRLAPLLNGPPEVKTASEPVIALLQTCVKAATTIINILSILHGQDLVGILAFCRFSSALLSLTEPFLPLDLQSVFSAGFILILTSIAYPYVTIDGSCIAKADEILGWMHSKGNVPAKSRRTELVELQAVADIINRGWSQSSFDFRTPMQDPSWLWDALDIDASIQHLNMASSSIDLMCNNALMVGGPEDMRGHRWFWASEHQQDMSTRPITSLDANQPPS